MSESGSEELEPEPRDEMEDGETVETLLRAAAGLLRELGYTGPLSDADALLRSCESGAECQLFTSLCVWLVSELKSVTPLVENVSPTEGPADSETFQLEMSGVMSELHCPYAALTSGNVTTRLLNAATCLQLIVFLSTDLEAARLLKKASVPTSEPVRHNEDVLEELQLIGKALDFPEISPDVPVNELMRELQNKVAERSGTVHVSLPLFKSQLQPEQWETLQELHYSMLKEYECRMRMLVTRFEVTVQSFHWSERAQVKEKSMDDIYWPLRKLLTAESRITIPRLLAVREDYSRILHTCNATFCEKTRTAIQKVLMTGTVPDRGGRPNEIEPPMPMWEKRREGGGGHQRWPKKNKRKRN
ncbi:protein FAM98C isoform X2 [Bufo bufo]|uniref:protein FAM98C isoform X2 n=1 Tax=Bufo bufo TaxID=8384 RepID=UPI001ABDF8DC|nr:protein FAM98C isoform X2 [Bufo bufo]